MSSILLLISHTGRGTHRDADKSVREGKYLAFPENNAASTLLFTVSVSLSSQIPNPSHVQAVPRFR